MTKPTSDSHWTYKGEIFRYPEDDHFGFVYKITDRETGEYYYGQKRCWSKIKRPPLKGRKRVRRDNVESDWKTYVSSSKKVQERIKTKGHDAFDFEILSFHPSANELTYAEARIIILTDAMRDVQCLNGILNCRITANGLKEAGDGH